MYVQVSVFQRAQLSWKVGRCAWRERIKKSWTIRRSVTSILGGHYNVGPRFIVGPRGGWMEVGALAGTKEQHMATEERVQIAIDNWAPRFLANGVDPNDFQRVTKRVERWDDWSREWSACAAVHEWMGEEAEAQECYQSAGYHYFHAAITYHFGKFLFVHRPDELRTAHEHVVHTYQKGLPYFDFPGERVAIPYEGGGTMYGILRKPWHTPKPPVVILIPGLDSVKEELHTYGDDFLRRGMAVLAIDGPGQGEMEFEYPLRYDYEIPIKHAIDYLERRPDVDARRIGVM